MKIDGKTALVLGAAKGIGRAVAESLDGKGARLILTCYDWPAETAEMKTAFSRPDNRHLFVATDLRKPEQVARLFAKIKSTKNSLDIVVNNIERGGMPVVHGPYVPKQWDLEMDTTLKAKWWVAEYALPLLKNAGEGTLITLSSISAIVGRSGPAGLIFNDGYAAANRAVSSFTKTWARLGAPTVRVNELMLGFFETRHAEKTRGWDLLTSGQRRAIIDHTLLKRTGKIREIVSAVLFLIEKASYMTGGVLRMDGGYVLGHSKVPPMPEGVLGESFSPEEIKK